MSEIPFVELADGEFIPTHSVVSVRDTRSGCEVVCIDGSIYRLRVAATEFVTRIRGTIVGGVFE